MAKTNTHCCDKINLHIQDQESPIKYEPEKRLYYLCNIAPGLLKKNEVCISYQIFHCPLCGIQFPKDLSSEWWNIMEKEFNISDFLDEKLNKIPKEFKTEEWWKKRKL